MNGIFLFQIYGWYCFHFRDDPVLVLILYNFDKELKFVNFD